MLTLTLSFSNLYKFFNMTPFQVRGLWMFRILIITSKNILYIFLRNQNGWTPFSSGRSLTYLKLAPPLCKEGEVCVDEVCKFVDQEVVGLAVQPEQWKNQKLEEVDERSEDESCQTPPPHEDVTIIHWHLRLVGTLLGFSVLIYNWKFIAVWYLELFCKLLVLTFSFIF